MNTKGKTLNWHFTTACNFCCRYCFIENAKTLDFQSYVRALEKIAPHFTRINFVGGEPTVSPYLLPLMRRTRELGLGCTIVTNGYNLIHKADDFPELYDLCSTIGISIDSLKDETNAKIGRAHKGEIISRSEYESLCKRIKDNGLRLKINTVVSALNKDEDFSDFYSTTNPDRIKLFQCLKPKRCLKQNYDKLLISASDFAAFVARHSSFADKIVAENNEAMTCAYYMLDAESCFLNDISGKKSPSLALSDVSAEKAMSFCTVDYSKYSMRYSA